MFASRWMCVCGLAVLGYLPGGFSWAQETAAPAPDAAEAPTQTIEAELAGVPGVEPGMTSNELIVVALKAARMERLTDAQKILFAVAKRNPDNIRALEALAYVYEQRADALRREASEPNAARQADRYIAAAVETYLYAAPKALETGNPQRAEAMYTSALLHQPTNPIAQLGLARVLRDLGQDLQAVERYKAYVDNPQAPADTLAQAYLELGQVYRRERYLKLAEVALQQGRRRDNLNVDILMELAQLHLDRQEYDEAVELARQAAEQAAGDPAYRNRYVQVLMAHRGREMKALRNRFDRLLRSGAEEAAIDRVRDQITELAGQLDQIRDEAKTVVDLAVTALRERPADQRLLVELSDYYATYRKVLRSILEQDPSRVALRLELVRVIREHSAVVETLNLHDALAVLEQAGDQAQNNIPLLERRAQLEFDVYRREDAAETCRQLLKLEPDNRVARQLLQQMDMPAEAAAATPE